jgi:hypothetical protein
MGLDRYYTDKRVGKWEGALNVAFRWECDSDFHNVLIVALDEDKIIFAVSENAAVDSYNSEMECTATMSRDEVIALRDTLNKLLD